MAKIKIPTKFNKTGTRVLGIPLDERWVCAPARRQYKAALASIEAKFRQNNDESRRRYVKTMSHLIATYVSSSSTPSNEKYMITKSLAQIMLEKTGPIATNGPGGWQPWSNHLWLVPELHQAAEDAWKIYVQEGRKSSAERDEEIRIAMIDSTVMRDALWRETSAHILYQVHSNGDKPKD